MQEEQPLPIARLCPDCAVWPGEMHINGCDVEACANCGHQLLSCGCLDEQIKERLPWTGDFIGVESCIEFGWYAKLVFGIGWVRCDKDDKLGVPDLNRLKTEAEWDRTLMKFKKKEKQNANV